MRSELRFWGAILVLWVCLPVGAQTGYEALLNWDALPNAKTCVTGGAATSYDRAGGNLDYNHYQTPPGFLDSDL